MTENINIKDVIHTEQTLTTRIDFKLYERFFLNEIYGPILRNLKNGPKTVKELGEVYYTPEDGKKKSENTIYYYLRELIDAGIVLEAGRRVRSDKISSKILYSLSSKYTMIEDPFVDIWNSEQGRLLADTVGISLRHHFDNKYPSLDEFLEFINEIVHKRSVSQKTVIEKLFKQDDVRNEIIILEIINKLSPEDFYFFSFLLGKILWFLSIEDPDSFVAKISSFFKKSTSPINAQKGISDEKIQSNEFKDIITYNPAVIKLVDIKLKNRYVGREKYKAIVDILRDNPKTIKEISTNHYATFAKFIKEKNRKNKALGIKKTIPIPKEPYKENTIYNFVKELIKAGFIVEAGRRVIPDQTSTQILYARTAKVFYTMHHIPDISKSDGSTEITNALGLIMSYNHNKHNFDHKTLHKLILEFETQMKEGLEKALIETTDERIIDRMFDFDAKDLETLMDIIKLFEWFIITQNKSKKELQNKIHECFDD